MFVSYSHSDDAFVVELAEKLEAAGIGCFKADRDIEPASLWTEAIWTAIRDCEVFLLDDDEDREFFKELADKRREVFRKLVAE